MKLSMGGQEMELGGSQLGLLRDSTDIRHDPEALRARMEEDGYLLIRGLHDRKRVEDAGRIVLEELERRGALDPAHPLEAAVMASGASGHSMHGYRPVTHSEAFLACVEAPELMDFFARFLGGEALTFDHKWVRAVGPGGFTGAHYDIVYMGRGTTRLYTLWTPLCEVTFEMAPIAVLEGSHRFDRVRETYGRMDVDRDHVVGPFSSDPFELLDRYGGRWLTAEFAPGDALIIGMYTMHASLDNRTNRYRISTDTRYQRADEPVDERWMGERPIGHSVRPPGEPVHVRELRERWGV